MEDLQTSNPFIGTSTSRTTENTVFALITHLGAAAAAATMLTLHSSFTLVKYTGTFKQGNPNPDFSSGPLAIYYNEF